MCLGGPTLLILIFLLELALGSLSKTRAVTVGPHQALSSVACPRSLRGK